MLDITAAGLLLESETVFDGIREVKEELELISFLRNCITWCYKYSVTTDDLIDNELAHVFLYDCALDWEQFTLQVEEVSGVVRVEITQFVSLWQSEIEEIEIIGFEVEEDGTRRPIHQMVDKETLYHMNNPTMKYYAKK